MEPDTEKPLVLCCKECGVHIREEDADCLQRPWFALHRKGDEATLQDIPPGLFLCSPCWQEMYGFDL